MEIYYTTRIQGRAGTTCGWSRAPGFKALFAVSLTPNAVGIFTEEGKPLDNTNLLTIKNVRGQECAVIAWHPLLALLAIGWKDGGISFWNAEAKRLEEDSKIHRIGVNCMSWTASGDRLVTADDNGRIAIWKTDRNMRPILVVAYDEGGAKVKNCVWGRTEANAESGLTCSIVYYAANAENRSIIKWADDQGRAGAVMEMTEELHSLIHYPERDRLVCITASAMLNVLAKDEQLGLWSSAMRMKFATATGEAASKLQVSWAGNHTLACASDKDTVVRMFNFDTEDNFTLSLDPDAGLTPGGIVYLEFDERYGLLGAGSADGRITIFVKHEIGPDNEPAVDLSRMWEASPSFYVGMKPSFIQWGPSPRFMAVVTQDGIHVCRKTLLSHRLKEDMAVVQAGVDKILLERISPDGSVSCSGRLSVDMQILGLDISKQVLMVYDGTRCETYKIDDGLECTKGTSFETLSRSMVIYNDSIFRTNENRVEVCNLSGVVKQTLAFEEAHGAPVLLDIQKDYMAVATTTCSVRVFKVAGREAKPHAGPGMLISPEKGANFKVTCVRANNNGTMVAALACNADNVSDSRLFIYCSENNSSFTYDFGKDDKAPQMVSWDELEPKLLAVQVLSVAREDLSADIKPEKSSSSCIDVATLFISPEHGALLQQYQSLDAVGAQGMIGLSAPHLVVMRKRMMPGPPPVTVHTDKLVLASFSGMTDIDDRTRRALLDFSFHLSIGEMEDAFRAVRAIRNPAVWENMATMCIKNKKLDVAEHCLGHIEHPRAARAVREAKTIDELEARVATVAIHMGLMDDAKKLYVACERFDLLNALFQSCGQWDKALEVAEKNDRIHLRSTHYNFAQHLEKTGDMKAAIHSYEVSGTAVSEVPRMMFERGQLEELAAYVAKDGSKEVLQWWARYNESRQEFQRALDCYEKAGDSLSIVRVFCYQQNFKAAEDEVSKNGDMAAAFHLARQYEAIGRASDAVRCYALARRYSHGVRLAKKNGLDTDLMNLALKSTQAVMVDTADYLHAKGEFDKAATLYMKGGKLRKAVDMCFEAQLFDVLQHIADDLGPDSDPALLIRCGEFFLEHGHFDKAVKMMIAARQIERALSLCLEHDIAITEEMAEALSPDKNVSAELRTNILRTIAKAAKRQGAFHLACKKYTQAGDKVKAMKALLRSGDTEKIVFFAGVSRQKEIYMMAANYLQTLKWHNDPEIMKNIIGFYTKAQAMESLASFYEACAQIEIDEYRDYEKALQAIRESLKYMMKSKSEDKGERIAAINIRISMTEKFVTARRLITEDPREALRVCQQLIQEIPVDSQAQELESGIRIGDVFALMIEYWFEQQSHDQAYQLIEQMRGRGIILSPYLDQKMVEDIYRNLGLEPVDETRGGGQQDAGGYIEEELEEQIDD